MPHDDATATARHRKDAGPLAAVSLAILALCLTEGSHWLRLRMEQLRHQTIRLAQEETMRTVETQQTAALFRIPPAARRRFSLTATAYCPSCGVAENVHQSAALGGLVRPGRTVAVSQDLKRLLGRKVYIDGLGVRVVEDLMHPRFRQRLDLCLSDREKAMAFGVKRLHMVVLD